MKFINVKRVAGIVLSIVMMCSTFASAGSRNFTDYFTMPFTMYLTGNNLVDGYPDGTFKPDNKINRAEAAVMLVKILGLQPDLNTNSSFTDVSNKHWAKPYISALTKSGYLSGYPDGRFGINDPLTIEQVAILMSRVASIESSIAVFKNNNKDWYYLFLTTFYIESLGHKSLSNIFKDTTSDRAFFVESMVMAKLYKQFGLTVTCNEMNIIPDRVTRTAAVFSHTVYNNNNAGGNYSNVIGDYLMQYINSKQ